MSDTPPLVPLSANTWHDIYADSGIAVGTALAINFHTTANKSYMEFSISATEPAQDTDRVVKVERFDGQYILQSGASGLWVRATSDALISVQDGLNGFVEGGGAASGSGDFKYIPA